MFCQYLVSGRNAAPVEKREDAITQTFSKKIVVIIENTDKVSSKGQ